MNAGLNGPWREAWKRPATVPTASPVPVHAPTAAPMVASFSPPMGSETVVVARATAPAPVAAPPQPVAAPVRAPGRMFPLGGTLRDAAAASGSTTHTLWTWPVPQGKRLLITRRVVLMDSSDTAAASVTGGMRLRLGGAVIFDSSAPQAGQVMGNGAVAGELIGPMALDLVYELAVDGGQTLQADMVVNRGATAVTLSMAIVVHGELVDQPR